MDGADYRGRGSRIAGATNTKCLLTGSEDHNSLHKNAKNNEK